jgi:hypothetical protein
MDENATPTGLRIESGIENRKRTTSKEIPNANQKCEKVK